MLQPMTESIDPTKRYPATKYVHFVFKYKDKVVRSCTVNLYNEFGNIHHALHGHS